MSKVSETAQAWKNFAFDRASAKKELEAQTAKLDQEIAALKARKAELIAAHDAEWDRRKDKTKRDRDEAIMEALRAGQSGTSILKEMRSNNTVLVYDLASRVKAEQAHRAPSPDEPRPDPNIEGLSWRYHPHTGVRGWLLSADEGGRYFKHYAPDADPDAPDGQWFVADRDLNFIAGDKALYDATARTMMGKRVKQLEALLAGEYTGPIKIAVGEPVFTH